MEGGKGGVGGCCWKRRGEHANGAKGMKEGERRGKESLMCCDAPVADLALPPLIYPDRSLCFILC